MNRTWLILGGFLVLTGATVGAALVAIDRDKASDPSATAGAELVTGDAAQAQDRAAQSDLRNALVAAKTYFTENETYTGFDLAAARTWEPALAWNGDAPAAVDVVSIDLAAGDEIVMSTLSASGQPFCISDDVSSSDPATLEADGVSFGAVDALGARTASDCSGTW
ncbi:MAG: hypothetical protein ACRDHU_11860 [Actinomycetota bacterium]